MIAVIDVCGNNLSSLVNALKRLNASFILTHKPEEIRTAKRVILPGVGSAKVAMQALNDHQLIIPLQNLTQPLLGICLGMQLLFESSEENSVDCLGVIEGQIKRLPQLNHLPIPHMGWNQLHWLKTSPLSQGLRDNDFVYFVHSYGLLQNEYALATCEYGNHFSAIVQKNNYYGMQFHPEKSAEVGLKLLQNFLDLE